MANTSMVALHLGEFSLPQYIIGRYSWSCRPTCQVHKNQGSVNIAFDPTVYLTGLVALCRTHLYIAATALFTNLTAATEFLCLIHTQFQLDSIRSG
jgi:hypothetical protein